ncbi:MAG: alpha/beta hydrolase [Oscillospiraceae bacterium]|nr:alpha/beta hydrolase [Oscillospiraceae bacterium]
MNFTVFTSHIMLALGRKKVRKKKPWIGKQYFVKRPGLPKTEVFLHTPKTPFCTPMPVMFNIHGGAWVGGDATVLDGQSQRIADTLGCFVVNINYHKVDEKAFPYLQEEVRDVVLHFAQHAEEFDLDVTKFGIVGYSAGGHLTAAVALMLKDEGFRLCAHVPVYPFLDFRIFDGENDVVDKKDPEHEKTKRKIDAVFFRGDMPKEHPYMSPNAATPEQIRGLSPAEVIICGQDPLRPMGVEYEKLLIEAGVPCVLKEYEKAVHGFAEMDWTKAATEAEQGQVALQSECIDYLKVRMQQHWENI